MKLKKVKIKNFRAFHDETEIEFTDLTAMIGKNDIGKSSILEALEIFFNNSIVVCDKDDLSVDSSDDEIFISCTFNELPPSLIIDTTVTTSLDDEYLLNKDKELEIIKVFKATTAKPKEKVLIKCQHPKEENYNDLLLLKNADLKKRAITLDIDKDKYNASINADIRRAIRESKGNLVTEETILPADKEDAKKIYESIKPYLPMYALFQSDRSCTDEDREVTDPMKVAVQQALSEISSDLDKIKEEVQKKALETADRTLNKLKEMSPDLADSLIPEFKSEPKFDSLFKLMIRSDDNIPINKRGSGVRRLVLLNFFRAEAERRLKESNNSAIIYAFEEPETSQHPDYQMLLIESFIELSHAPNTQIILTTHTPALASMLQVESLRYICINEERRTIKYGDDMTYELISQDLGILPSPITTETKGILFVEGPGDAIFVNHTANCLFSGGYIDSTFEKSNIAVIPIGGCGTLKYWVNLKLIEQFHLPWCILLDSDKGGDEETNNVQKIEKLREQGIKAYVTRKREPENYLHYDCIREKVEFSETDDAKIIINQATNIAKNEVLIKLWPKMTTDHIREVERYEDEGVEHFEFTEMFSDFLKIVN